MARLLVVLKLRFKKLWPFRSRVFVWWGGKDEIVSSVKTRVAWCADDNVIAAVDDFAIVFVKNEVGAAGEGGELHWGSTCSRSTGTWELVLRRVGG